MTSLTAGNGETWDSVAPPQMGFLPCILKVKGNGGISALELDWRILVTYKTAWYVPRRLRLAMGSENRSIFQDGAGVTDGVLG